MDNSWIVPYNLFLSKKYDAHINVEICSSIRSIKYIHKYVLKGHDRAQVTFVSGAPQGGQPIPQQPLQPQENEIKEYQDGRYVSSIEAMWRIYEFDMHAQVPSVYGLDVHLPDEQSVVFSDTTDIQAFVAGPPPTSKLMAWFKLNLDCVIAHDVLYGDLPSQFTWNQNEKMDCSQGRGSWWGCTNW
jgi:ATP-dependent DNA helicase PIF1